MSNKSLAGTHESQTILVTGGAGFIGSHTCVELLEQGYNVVILDDLSNSSSVAVDRIRELTGASTKNLTFIKGSILDRAVLDSLFANHDISAIIHFAGFKAVGESTHKPLEY
ncbi:MAG: SDR family NAD(P)-dependent oxidoreductase, partial [Eggerthellaceae bacterium]